MVNVDDLTRSFERIRSRHIAISDLLSSRDCAKRPRAYADTKFSNHGNINIIETKKPSSNKPQFLTNNIPHRFYQDSTTRSETAPSLEPSAWTSITSLPIHM